MGNVAAARTTSEQEWSRATTKISTGASLKATGRRSSAGMALSRVKAWANKGGFRREICNACDSSSSACHAGSAIGNDQTTGEQMPHHDAHSGMSSAMQHCIDACTSCANTCTATLHHCLHMGGSHAEAEHITTLLDCAEICRTSADFLLRMSPHHKETCRACATLCRACEKSCRKLDGEEMKRCADECAKCAESCEKMAGMVS